MWFEDAGARQGAQGVARFCHGGAERETLRQIVLTRVLACAHLFATPVFRWAGLGSGGPTGADCLPQRTVQGSKCLVVLDRDMAVPRFVLPFRRGP